LQGVRVRRAGPADAAAVAKLGAETFVETFGHLYPPADLAAFLGDAHGPAQAQANLADPTRAIWLAEADGASVGYALAGQCDLPHPEVAAGDGELKRIYLRSAAQGSGLGGQLFDAALSWLQRDGPRTVWIGVWSENHGAQQFYARRGFVRVGCYGFRVGETVDQELILRRTSVSFAAESGVDPQ
jgi:ribosomal protein S18 acetylase RimI-like enzyme